MICKYFWRSCSSGDFSKGTFESFELDGSIFISFRVNPIQAGGLLEPLGFWGAHCSHPPPHFSFICCPITTKLGLILLWHKSLKGSKSQIHNDVIFALLSIKYCWKQCIFKWVVCLHLLSNPMQTWQKHLTLVLL